VSARRALGDTVATAAALRLNLLAYFEMNDPL
jgi:hypothetical protein